MIRFSAERYDQAHRFDAWREEFAKRIANNDMERLDDPHRPFHAEIANLPLGRVLFAHARGTPVRMFRDERHVADRNGDFTLVVPKRGNTRIARGEDVAATQGGAGALLLAYWDPASAAFHAGDDGWFEAYRYVLPREVMLTAVPDADALCFRPIVTLNIRALDYLVQYTDKILLSHPFTDASVIERTSAYLVDLVAMALGPTRDAAAIGARRGFRAGLLQAMLAQINAECFDPRFDVQAVAERHRVSVRYVQRLLERQGETFSHHVLRLRLDRVAAMLADPGHRDMRIGEIALACGFNDLSYFNRSFKRRFGERPRAFRK